MFQTTVATYSAFEAPLGVRPVAAEPGVRRERAQEAVDAALADSFPASDPPAWTPGEASAASPLPVDPPRRSGSMHPFARTLVSFAGASGLMLLVPVVILLLGLPVVLGVRGLLELFQWAFAGLL